MLSDLDDVFQSLPVLRKKDFNCLKTGKQDVDQWYEELNHADPVGMLNAFVAFLSNTNQYHLKIEERSYLLEKLHLPVLSLVGNLKIKILQSSMPLSSRHQDMIDLFVLLYNELRISHSLILRQQLEYKNRSWSFLLSIDKKIALTIQRIMRYISQIILTEFEVYREPEKSNWQILFSLFRFSEQKNFSEIMVEDPITTFKTSVKITFLQPILLALSDPYHFNRQQIYYIYKQLALWAKWVNVRSQLSPDNDFYNAINLSDNLLPTFYPRGYKPKQKYALYIDTHRLTLDKLNEEIGESSHFLSPKIKGELLLQLKKSWTVYAQRKFDRNDYYAEMRLVLGLKHVHFVLNQYVEADYFKSAEYTSKLSAVEELIRVEEVNDEEEEIFLEEQVTYQHDAIVDDTSMIYRFLTENESLNGLSLIWTCDAPIDINIGEVVALSSQQKEKPDEWFVGMVRRIQHFKNQPLRMGVQVLSTDGIHAVIIRRQNRNKRYRAILLPELYTRKGQRKISLLVDALTFEQGDRLIMESEHFSGKFQLKKELETTQYYMRFLI